MNERGAAVRPAPRSFLQSVYFYARPRDNFIVRRRIPLAAAFRGMPTARRFCARLFAFAVPEKNFFKIVA